MKTTYGSWKTYISVDGKRKEVVRKTQAELYEVLFAFYREQDKPTTTLEEAFEKLEQYKLDELGLDYKTILDDRYRFRRISDELKRKPLQDITEEELRQWFVSSYLPTKPKELDLKKMIWLINRVFNLAISRKLCNTNPAMSIQFIDYAKKCDHTKKPDEVRSFSDDEIEKLRQDALLTLTNPRSLMRLLAIETGMRAAELPALHKDDILDDSIHVHRQIVIDRSVKPQAFREMDYTKDERQHPHDGRLFPITPAIAEILRLAEQLPGDSEYIFHDANGRFITPDTYERHLRRACKKLGIDTTNNHGFRIALNSRLIKKKVPSDDRALILGHSVATNERHYSITDRRRLDDIKSKL